MTRDCIIERMSYEIRDLDKSRWPKGLSEIPQPPKKLRIAGQDPDLSSTFLAVVGARKCTPYGEAALRKIFSGLAEQNITIVSGLALGIDTIAHTLALEYKLKTIAFPGSGLDPHCLYPKTNRLLAEKILQAGGTLLAEYPDNQQAAPWTFPQRNRLMAGLSQAVLVVEALRPSGTLITSKLALDYNKEVLAIPGSILSTPSDGPNWLISRGATPVTTSDTLLEALNLLRPQNLSLDLSDLSGNEQMVLEILTVPADKDTLIASLPLSDRDIDITLSTLEIKGLIKIEAGYICRQI